MILRNQDGFVALISAAVVAAILLAISLSLGLTGFFARFNTLELEYKERSLALAEGCIEAARLKLTVDLSYAGNETISSGSFTCDILPVTTNAGVITIRTKAVFPQATPEKAVTNLVVKVSSPSLNVISWRETPN